MTVSANPATSDDRLNRLLAFLDRDPGNLNLLADAAAAAFDARALQTASDLLARYAALTPLPPELINLRGLIALGEQRYRDASLNFETLLDGGAADPGVRFNLAWSKAMLQDHAGAAELLDDSVIAVSPRAASLKIEMLHHLGLFEDALACGQSLAELYPDNKDLMGALSVLALDAEEVDLARHYATQAGDSPEGLSTLGTLMLNDHQVDEALTAFQQAIDIQGGNARAWVGKGLSLLSKGDEAAAAESIDRGAELFGDHIGSWIASGWTWFIRGQYATSRVRFEKALAFDDNFAESHGGLAVLDIIEGKIESARRRTDIALRLDRKCFSGALARSLLLSNAGEDQAAQRIREIALNQPIGRDGQTIAQAMAGLGMASGNNSRKR